MTASFMTTNQFGPASTMLTGPSTYNGMGVSPAAASPAFSDFLGTPGGAMSVVGAIGSAISSYYSAQLAKNSIKHQARMGEINARVSELGAQSALLQGRRQEQSLRLQTAQLKSRQRVAFAANGIDIAGSESALNVLTSTDYMGEMDALTIQHNTLQDAWSYRMQGANYMGQADMARADAAGVSPFGAGATSLLSGATLVADRWYAWKQQQQPVSARR